MLQELSEALIDMQEEEALQITQKLLDSGADPFEILNTCRAAMDEIGALFESGEYFLPELVMAGEILSQIAAMVKPHIEQEAAEENLGTIVFGTVAGDIHDIGKNIVVFLLEINGFEVLDLGIDVPVSKFVEAVHESGAKIVGLSGFLTVAFDPMKATVAALREASPDIRIMIGGGQVDDNVLKYTQADAYGKDAMAAVSIAKAWAGE